MTKALVEKVLKMGTVDTKNYRYIYSEDVANNKAYIKRLPIAYLDTTRALTDWEIVKEL